MTSPITQILNHLSNTAVLSAIGGGVGFLCTRAVKTLDPRLALICGAAPGVITGLFMARRSNHSSRIVGLGGIIAAPFVASQMLALPAQLKIAGIVTAASFISIVAIATLFRAAISRVPTLPSR